MKFPIRKLLKARKIFLLIPLTLILFLVDYQFCNFLLKNVINNPTTRDLNLRSADFLFTFYNKNSWNLSEKEIESLTLQWREKVDSVHETPDYILERGVIYSTFPANVHLAVKSIKILRHLGCSLPIHVYHASELANDHISLFESLSNVTVIDIKEKLKSMGIELPPIEGKQFHFKSAAIIYSDFKEILFLDNDNIPIRDPTFLFSNPNYLSTGTIFWKDLWKTHPNNPIHKILEIPVDTEFEQESGQLVINKVHPGVYKALQLAFYMQLNSKTYFKFLMGDKDTFKYAFKALKLPYYLVENYVSPVSYQSPFKGSMMGQYEPGTNDLLFIHQNLLKYSNVDLRGNVTFLTVQRYEDPIALYGIGEFRDSHIFLKEYYDHTTYKVNKVLELDFQELHPGFEQIYDMY